MLGRRPHKSVRPRSHECSPLLILFATHLFSCLSKPDEKKRMRHTRSGNQRAFRNLFFHSSGFCFLLCRFSTSSLSLFTVNLFPPSVIGEDIINLGSFTSRSSFFFLCSKNLLFISAFEFQMLYFSFANNKGNLSYPHFKSTVLLNYENELTQ